MDRLLGGQVPGYPYPYRSFRANYFKDELFPLLGFGFLLSEWQAKRPSPVLSESFLLGISTCKNFYSH